MAIDGVGLIVFGGVGDDFSFVPAEDAWLLRSATDVQPRSRVARPMAPASEPDSASSFALFAPRNSTPMSATPTPSTKAADGPSPRACLGLCADRLTMYIFGGFDGDRWPLRS